MGGRGEGVRCQDRLARWQHRIHLQQQFNEFARGLTQTLLVLIPHNLPKRNIAWSRATILSAGAMAIAGYAYSALFNATGGNHRLLFLTAAMLLAIARLGEIRVSFKRRPAA